MMRLLLILLLILSGYTGAQENLLNEQVFTQKYVVQLKKEVQQADVKITDELELTVALPDGSLIKTDLHNAYKMYKTGGDTLTHIFNSHINMIDDNNFDRPLTQIMPVIKSSNYIATVQNKIKELGAELSNLPFYRKINQDLYEVFVIDSKEKTVILTAQKVQELGIENTITDIAHNNLRNYFSNIDTSFTALSTNDHHIFLFNADNFYESSILVNFDGMTKSTLPNIKQWIIYPVSRNIAILADKNDNEAVKIATHLAKSGYNEYPYSISPYGYIQKDNRWVRFHQ